jgi:hypothetical protein
VQYQNFTRNKTPEDYFLEIRQLEREFPELSNAAIYQLWIIINDEEEEE